MRTLPLSMAVLASFVTVHAQEPARAPIATPIDRWRPVRPGTWTITSTRTDAEGTQKPVVTTIEACPYPATLFLNDVANIRLGEAGCQYQTFQLSERAFHVAARCRALRGPDHVESTTLHVPGDGRQFSAVTTWATARGNVTVWRDGVLAAECRAR